jgi:hypothetical protein
MGGVGIGRLRRRALVGAMVAALVATTLGTASPVSAVSDPVARWKLDEGSAATANDDIGTADGTISGGPAWLTSNVAVGSAALRLDGNNDQVTIPSSSAIEPAEASVSLWVRGDPNDPPATGDVILEKGSFACNGPSYGIYVDGTGFSFSFRSPTGEQIAGQTDGNFGVVPWDGNWHLLTLSIWWNVSGPQVIAVLSIDGYPGGTQLFTDTLPPGPAQAITYAGATHSELVVGGPVDAACGASHFHGDIDDVRVYNDPGFYLNAGTLMPPIPVTVSGLQPVTVHAGEEFTTSVDLSPHPRWGEAFWYYLKDDAWIECCTAGVGYIDTADGHVEASALAPAAVGTFDFKAEYHSAAINIFLPTPPYQDATSSTTTLEVLPWSTTTTVAASAGPHQPYDWLDLTATVTSTAIPASDDPVGSVKFYDTTPDTPVLLGTKTLVGQTASGVSKAVLSLNTLGPGTHAIEAEFVGPDPVRTNSTSDPLDVAVEQGGVSLAVAPQGGVIEAGVPFYMSATLDSPLDYTTDATVTFKKVGSSTPICTLAASNATQCLIPGQPIGDPQFYVEYSGNWNVSAKTSAPVAVHVVANTAQASGVGVQYATFYPVKDGYRDTVAIRGTTWEAITVTIKIYKPSGALLRTVTVPANHIDYSWAWNGRTSSGSILPEGKYKVVQSLKDATNITKTVTSFVTLSKKKLAYHTVTLTQTGSSLDARGHGGTGTVTVYSGSHSVRLRATSDGFSYAAAGWQYTLPSAAVYKTIVAKFYGRRSGGSGTNALGAQRFDWSGCAYHATGDWNINCFQHTLNIPSTSGTTLHTYKSGALNSHVRSGRKVRLDVLTLGGTIYVYKMSVVVTYGVLTY